MSKTLPKSGTPKPDPAFDAIAHGDFGVGDPELALFRELLEAILADGECPQLILRDSRSRQRPKRQGAHRD